MPRVPRAVKCWQCLVSTAGREDLALPAGGAIDLRPHLPKGLAARDDAGADMLQGWVVIAVALGYIGLLFVVASYGDRARRFGRHSRARIWIYPLSLAIYCT